MADDGITRGAFLGRLGLGAAAAAVPGAARADSPGSRQALLEELAAEHGMSVAQLQNTLLAGSAEYAASNGVATKAQRNISQAQSDEVGQRLEDMLSVMWTTQRNDHLPGQPDVQARPNLIIATYGAPDGRKFDLSAVAQQWDFTGVSDQPEIYLRARMEPVGKTEFNSYRRLSDTFVAYRVRSSSQPLAGSDVTGNPLSNPAGDKRILDLYMNPQADPSGTPQEVYFTHLGLNPLAADPGIAFKILNINNLNGHPVIPGVRQDDTKPGKELEEWHTPTSAQAQGLITENDIAAQYVLSRVAGARFVDNERAYGSRIGIWRGPNSGPDGTEYVVGAWITEPGTRRMLDPDTQEPAVGYFEATVTVDWNEASGKIGPEIHMQRTAMDLPGNMNGGIYLRKRPNIILGEQVNGADPNEFSLLGNLTPEIYVPTDNILPDGPGGDPLRVLPSYQ